MLADKVLPIDGNDDIVLVRQETRRWATQLGFSLVETTKMVTAASELARNALEHGGGGTVQFRVLERDRRRGLCLTFHDEGPGIPDLERAMTDGYSTGSGLGLGLSGSKRLVNDFSIDTAPGKGTTVRITRWR